MSNLWHEFVAEYPLEADTRDTWFVWDAIPAFDREAVLEGLRIWKNSEDWADRRFIPNAVNFLRREMWKQTPRSVQDQPKPFNPFEDEKPLSQEELFRRRHITSRDAYYMYLKAQDPNNYVYKPRSKA